MKKLIFAAVAALFVSSCSTVPKISSETTAEPGREGFYAVTNLQQFASAQIKNADVFQKYTKVIYSELNVADIEIDKSRLSRSNDYWELKDKDVTAAQRMFVEQLNKYYQKERNLSRVSDAQENTLKVDVALTKYRPNAPRDDSRGRGAGEMYFTEGAGRLYMVTQVSDAQSGELLAVFEDDRELGSTWEKDSQTNNTRRFKQGLYTWIQRIDNAIAQLR